MGRRTIAVSGMSCTGCEQNVEEALGGIEGVESADADHEGDAVEVVADEGVADDDLHAAIKDAGYEVAG